MTKASGVLVCLALVGVLTAAALESRRNRWKGHRQKENCHHGEVENCFAIFQKYANDSESSRLLSTSRGLDEVCINSRELVNCLRSHVEKCGTLLHRDLFDFISDEFFKSVDHFCRPGQLREDFLKESPCIVEKVLITRDYKKACNVPFLSAINTMRSNQSMEKRMDIACCSYNVWESCLYDKVSQQCGDRALKAIKDFVRMSFKGMPAMVCPREMFDSQTEICKSLTPLLEWSSSSDTLEPKNPISKYVLGHLGFLFYKPQ